MSTAISSTRAAVPRLTSKALRCRRSASTEAVSVQATTAPTVVTQRPKPKKTPESLEQKMHRVLYPELYRKTKKDPNNWRPSGGVERGPQRKGEQKMIADKWAPVMRKQGVNATLSTYTQNPMPLQQSRLSQLLRQTIPRGLKS
jgi:large subunit ribosomal protein L19